MDTCTFYRGARGFLRGRGDSSAINNASGRSRGRGRRRRGRGWNHSARSPTRSKSVDSSDNESVCSHHGQSSRTHDPGRLRGRKTRRGGRGWNHSARTKGKSVDSSDNDNVCGYQWPPPRTYDTDNESVCSYGSQSAERRRRQLYAVGRGPIEQQRGKNQDTFDFTEASVFKFLVKKTGGLSSVSKLKEDFTAWSGNFTDLLEEQERLSIFKRQNNPVCVGPFLKNATFCFDHGIHGGCRRKNCYNFHICKFYLNGGCKLGNRCQKGHSFTDPHNDNKKENLGLEEFTDDEIKVIILCRYPQVCRAQSCAAGENCPYIHICYNFLMDKCDEHSCQRDHSFETPHNKWVLQVYKMERWPTQKLALLKRLINMPRRQVQQSENRMYVPHHPLIQTSNEMEYEPMSVDGDEYLGWNVTKMTPRRNTIDRVHNEISKDVQKQLATSDSLKESNAHKKDICLNGLSGACRVRDCDHHHARLPYVWQVNIYGDWISFDDEENQKLEQCYCNLEDVATAEVNTIPKFGVTLHFTEEYATCNSQFGGNFRNSSCIASFRRLSTASFAKDDVPLKLGSFHTQWRWYFKNDYGQWMLYDQDVLQHTLEKKYITGQRTYLFTRESHKLKYEVEFSKWKQTNIETSKVRKIMRRPVFVSRAEVTRQQFPILLDVKIPEQTPPHWDPLDLAHDFEIVNLEETNKEYSGVKTAFFATLREKNFQICNIYRVQNLALWNEYRMKKLNMERVHAKNIGSVDERSLFHGTDSFDTCYGICTNNFDFRLSGKNATMYGKGSYFAVSSKYSNSYTKGPTRLMFQAKVLIGSYTNGTHDMTCPPNIPGKGHKRYDTCVNDSTNPSIFVVFDRNQCYPEYLIAYKEINVGSNVDTVVPNLRRPTVTTLKQSPLGTTVAHTRNPHSYSATSHSQTSTQAGVSSNPTSSQTLTALNQSTWGTTAAHTRNSHSYSATPHSQTSAQVGVSSNPTSYRTLAQKPMATASSSYHGNSSSTSGYTNSVSSPSSLSSVTNQQSSASIQSQVPASNDQAAYSRTPASPARSSIQNVSYPVKKKKETCTIQ